tara:strand:- start:117 stop:485 length:369 start_codon:yes stop_codon:yes gene_type:complete
MTLTKNLKNIKIFINNINMPKRVLGSRREVYNGTAKRTTGGLEKKDLFYNKYGRIVSLKKHLTAKKEKRLQKYGWTAKKGKFGGIKIKVKSKSPSKSKSRSKSKSGKKRKGKQSKAKRTIKR